jgi:hypothetical protein
MSEFNILVKNRQGVVMAEKSGDEECCLIYKDAYLHGDSIVFEASKYPAYVVVSVDDAIESVLVYMKEPTFAFQIPFDEKKFPYSPKAFSGNLHMLRIRVATESEIWEYRNLAVNTLDQHENTAIFPHASANVETRGESVFAAQNAIDGNRENESHGNWPYESWGINMQDDAELTIDFGRTIITDKIILYTRADFPHDNWWTEVTFTFSDGTEMKFEMEKSVKPHVCEFAAKKIEWLKLGKLIKSNDPSLFPALSQIEVYGKNQRD